jgi:autotransporter-associated beta strand protein
MKPKSPEPRVRLALPKAATLTGAKKLSIRAFRMVPEVAFRGSAAALALMAFCGFNPQSLAATITMGATAGDLSTGAVWVGGIAPGPGDIALFNSTIAGAQTDTITSAALSIGEIQISNPGGTITINGPDALTLNGVGGVGIDDYSLAIASLTIGAPIVLGANQLWEVGSGKTLTISGGISGSGVGFTKTGPGQLTINTTASSFTGTMTLDGGIIQLTNPSAATNFLSSSSSLAVNGGALVESQTGAASTNTQTYASTSIGQGEGQIEFGRVSGGTVKIQTGTVTRSAGGTVQFNGVINKATNQYIETSNANGFIGGWAYTDSLLFASSNGANANVTNAAETANAWGTTTNTSITANYTAAAGTTQSVLFGTAGAFTLTLTGADVIGSGGILMNTTPAANVETITGGTSLTSGNGTDLIVGQFDTTAGGSLAINANITDNGGTSIGLTKVGGGVLNLGGANTFTGPVYLNDGTVKLTASTALGSGVNAINFGNSYNSSGTLALNGFNATVSALSTANVNAGLPVVQDGAATGSVLTINDAGTSVYNGTVQSGSTGALSVIKTGAGSQTLAGSNTYTGNTTVNNGSLIFTTSIPSSPTFSVAGGATLNTASAGTIILGTTNSLTTSAAPSTTANVLGAVTLNGGAIVTGSAGSTLSITTLASNSGSYTFSITDPTSTSGTSSLITVTGSGALTINGGTINLTGGSFPSGASYNIVYDLFQYTGALGGAGTAALSVASASEVNGLTYALGTSGGYVTLTVTGSPLFNSSWITDGNGSWASSANWSAGVPNAQSATANLGGAAATHANLARTVTLDGNETVGVLAFTSPNGESYTIDAGTGGALILDNGSSAASISASGTHTIDGTVAVDLNSNVTIGDVAPSDVLTIAGNIVNNNGAHTLTKSGPGLLVLTNSNSYGPAAGSFGTFLNAGTIQIQNNNSLGAGNLSFGGSATLQSGTAGLTVASNITIGNGFTATVDTNGNTFTLPGNITDTSTNGVLSVVSTIPGGTLIVTGDNTYGGGTSIGSGATLQVGNNTPTVSLTGTAAVTDNGALVFNLSTPGNVTIANTISGAGSLTENNSANQLVLTGSNSYSGGTIITSGSIQVGNSYALGSGNVSVAGASLLDLNGASPTVGALNGSGIVTSSSNVAMTLSIGNNNNSGTFSGSIIHNQGTISVTKNGTGTETFSGPLTYLGATTVNGGVLTISSSLGTSGTYSGAITDSSATLNLTNATVYAASLTENNVGGSGVYISGTGTTNISGALAVNAANGTNAGLVSITGGTVTAGSITVGRTGNNYAGNIQYAASNTNGLYINGGTLIDNGTLGIGTSTATQSSAEMRIDSGSVTVAGTTIVADYGNTRYSVLDINGGTFTATGGIAIGGAGTGGYGELLVRGTGILNTSGIVLGNTAETSGNDALQAIGGTTYIGSGGITESVASGSTAVTLINLGYASVATAPVIAASAPWSSSLPMVLTNSSGAAPVTFQTADSLGNAQNIALSGNLTGTGGLIKTGAGVLTLSGSNTFSGNIAVNGGTLALATSTPFGNGTISFGGGTLQYSSLDTVDYSARFATSASPVSIDTNGQQITFANSLNGAFTGTGGLTLVDSAGGGSLTLTKANTFTGPTIIGTGATLKLVGGSLASASITNSGNLLVNGGGTLGSTGGSGLILNGGSQFSMVDGAANTLSLPGNLTIGGASATALAFELNSTTSDNITVGGNVSYGAGGGLIYLSALNSNSAPLSGSTFDLITDANGLGSAAFTLETTTLIIGGSSYSLSLAPNVGDTEELLTVTALSSNLNYYFLGAHTPSGTWSDVANFATDHTGATAQNVSLSNTSNVFLVADNATTGRFQTETLDGTYNINSLSFTGTNASVTNTPAATTGITLNAGTGGALTLTATNSFTDSNGNIYGGGTGLVVQAGSAAHTINANINLGNSQIWEIDNAASSPLTMNGVIANGTTNDSLTKIGAGTLILNNNANTYTGGTYVEGGTLALGPTGALPATGTLTVSGSGTFDVAGTSPALSSLSDGGTNTGIITNSAASSSTITFNNTAPLSFSGTITDANATNSSSLLGLSIAGSAPVTLSGSNSYNGLTTVNGTLIVANNYALGNAFSPAGGLLLQSGTVDFTSANPNISGLNPDGSTGTGTAIILGNASGAGSSTTLNIGAGGAANLNGFSYAGTISDLTGTKATAIGNLNITGGSFVQLESPNTFTGITTISGANTVLQLASATALQDSTLNYNNQGGTLQFASLTGLTLAGLTGSQNLALLNTSSGAITLTIGNNNVTSVYSGNLSGAGAALNKTGSGTFTLGSNGIGGGSYTGATTLTQGTLIIGGTSDLTGAVNLPGTGPGATTLTIQDNAIVNLTTPLIMVSAGGNAYPTNGLLNVQGNASLTTAGFSIGNATRVPTGNIVTVSGSATFTDNGTFNFYSSEGSTAGNSTVNLNGGTLAAQSLIRGGGGGTGSASTFNLNGGTLKALASDPTSSTFLPALTSLTVNIQAGGAYINTNGFNDTIAATLNHNGSGVDGGLIKNGAGTLSLTGPNSFTGGAVINAGTLNINGEFALGGSVYGGLTFNGGTLQYSTTLPTSGNGSGDITQESTGVVENVSILAGGGTVDTNGNTVVYANSIGNNGTGFFTKIGAGSLTLTKGGTYTGATNVNAGTLVVSGALSATSALAINGGTASLTVANAINSAAHVTLTAGTLQTLANQTQQFADLTLGAGSSTLSLGTTGSVLNFADSSANTWTGTLAITNWNGNSGGAGSDELFIGITADLSPSQLADISFLNPVVNGVAVNGTVGATQLADGELVAAIPEPGTWAMLLAGAAMLGAWQQRSRRLSRRD